MKRTELIRKTPLRQSRIDRTKERARDRGEFFDHAGFRAERAGKKRRPSETPFRNAVLEHCGRICVVAGCGSNQVQAAHIWGKGQGGPTVYLNGVPMCQPHHSAYDSYTLRIRAEWLTSEQIEWLAEAGYVTWGPDGEPSGLGCRRFEPTTSRA